MASDLSRIAVLVSYDEDDATMTPEIIAQAEAMHPGLIAVKGASKTKIAACNDGVNDFPADWDIIILVSDDMFCRRKGWDDILREQMRKNYPDTDGVLWFHDGTKQRVIMTLSCIGRKYYERDRFIYHPSYASFFCLHPDTKIYMADQTTRKISDILVGDVVVGAERRMPNPRGNAKLGGYKLEYLCKSVVTAVHSRQAERIKITTRSGEEIICTPDHRWARYGNGRSLYVDHGARDKNGSTYHFSTPFVGMKMVSVVRFPGPPPEGLCKEIGWMSGIIDGEGSFPRITQSEGHNPKVCREIERVLKLLGIPFTKQTVDPAKYGLSPKLLNHYYFNGGRDTYLKVLDWMRPVKNDTTHVQKRMFAGRFGTADEIIKIESAGIGEVVCLSTTTRNFVAEGFLSHNCDNEATDVARSRGRIVFIEQPIATHENPCWNGGMKRDTIYVRNNKFWRQDELNYAKRKEKGFP
jgi:hypothetical protein